MKKERLVLIAFLPLVTIWGCASIIEGRTQAVTFNSEPSGAKVVINGIPMGVTPATITLKKSEYDNANVVFKMDGYQDQQANLHTKVTGWFWGNVISGGLLGSATDAISGAMWEYSPDKYMVTLPPQKASAAEMARWQYANNVRKFLLFSHEQLAFDLARGQGEYLSSVLSMLSITEDGRDLAIGRLRQLSEKSQAAPEFAEKALTAFRPRQL